MVIDLKSLAKNFAKKVKLERVKMDISQEKLAELAGLNRTTISAIERWTTISAIERCKMSPTLDTVGSLANAFGLTIEEMFNFNF